MMKLQTLGMVASIAFLFWGGPTLARNATCWGDDSRGDISCARITEKLLLSLRGQTEADVRKIMDAPGRKNEEGLHFLSNYSRGTKAGSGDLNVWFEDGKATSISAAVDIPNRHNQEFTWSAYLTPPLGQEIDRSTKNFFRPSICSDLSGLPVSCAMFESGINKTLSLMQMQGSVAKSNLIRTLEAACNPGQGLTVSDPTGDCPRLRTVLQ